MSWSLSFTGTREEIAEKVKETEGFGHFPAAHRVLVEVSVSDVPPEYPRIALSAYGSRRSDGAQQNCSVTVSGLLAS